jgi:hypothetical protein
MKKAKRDMTNFREFLKWLKSDNVIRTGLNEYRSQCSLYSIAMTKKQAYAYFKKEYLIN